MTDLRQLFDDLVRFETLLWNDVDQRVRAAGELTLAGLNVLDVVDRTDRCRVQDIARALAITTGGASQAVDRLVRQQACERTTNDGDRRSSFIALTPAGVRMLRAARRAFDAALADAFSAAGSGVDLDHLAVTLGALRAAADTTEPGARP